jgi:Photosynthesis system II assembly factor YCF48
MTDPFDQIVVATRDRLRYEAQQAVNSDVMLREILDGGPRVQTLRDFPDHNRRGRILAVAALIVVVVGGLVALQRGNDQTGTPEPASTVAPTPTIAVSTSLLPTSAVPTSIVPTTVAATTIAPTTVVATTTASPVSTLSGQVIDMSWVDAQHGWALLADSQSSTSVLSATSDGGKTWQSSAVDTHQAAHVTFADLINGWMFSDGFGEPSNFQSTHDGGTTWQAIDLTSAGMIHAPQALATEGDTVTIVAQAAPDQNTTWTVATSPIGVDHFTKAGIDFQSGAGPVADFSIANSGGNTWVVYNDRVVSGVARLLDGTPTPWTPPWTDLVGPAIVAVAKDGGPLYAQVNAGEWGGSVVENQLYVSDDKGDTFRQATLPLGAAPGTSAAVYAVDASTLVVTISKEDGSSDLYRSHDEGSTWQPLSTLSGGGAAIEFVDSTTAYSTTSTSDGEQSVMKSADGGATWQPIVTAVALG